MGILLFTEILNGYSFPVTIFNYLFAYLTPKDQIQFFELVWTAVCLEDSKGVCKELLVDRLGCKIYKIVKQWMWWMPLHVLLPFSMR